MALESKCDCVAADFPEGLIDDSPDEPSTNVRFVAVEWDGPKETELVLHRTAGGELKPVIVNHKPVSAQVVAENE